MGYIHLFLALAVMAYHLVEIGVLGRLAVLGFYALSGYGCTASIVIKGGGWQFLKGRFWRVYPLYVAVFLLSSVVWMVVGFPHISGFGVDGWGDWLRQLFFLGRIDAPAAVPQELRLIPQSWMLPVMMYWWLLMAMGLGSSSWSTYMWLGVSATGYAALRINPIDSGWYFSPFMASLPFAIGSAAYWAGVRLSRGPKWVGALSYPTFLVHYQIGALIPIERGWALFTTALLPTLLVSWALVRYIENPVQRYRQNIKVIP